MPIYQNIKRVFQSLDLRFNKLINARVSTPRNEDHKETVVNKEYVDKSHIFRSKLDPDSEYNREGSTTTILEVLDETRQRTVASLKKHQTPTVNLLRWEYFDTFKNEYVPLDSNNNVLIAGAPGDEGTTHDFTVVLGIDYHDYLFTAGEDIFNVKLLRNTISTGVQEETTIQPQIVKTKNGTIIEIKWRDQLVNDKSICYPQIEFTFKRLNVGNLLNPVIINQSFESYLDNFKFSTPIWISYSQKGTNIQTNKINFIRSNKMVITQTDGISGCIDVAVPKAYLDHMNLQYFVYDDVSKKVVIPNQSIIVNSSNFIDSEISFDNVPMIFCRIELRKFETPVNIVLLPKTL